VGGWGNSSSKAFGISFADRPKAKSWICKIWFFLATLIIKQQTVGAHFKWGLFAIKCICT
jgi:hypothetical protein